MNNNNILILSSEFPPGPGGIGNHAYNLALGLHNHNYKTHVISIVRSDEDRNFDLHLPFTIDRVSSGKFLQKAALIISTIRKLSKNSELIIIASGMAMLIISGFYSYFFKRTRIKFFVVAHGIDINPTAFLHRQLVAIAIQQVDKVIAVSSYTASKIRGVPNSKIVVINNGFDPHKIGEIKLSNERTQQGYPNLLTVGSVTFRKGQINVVNALPALIKEFPNIHYHMVGVEVDKDTLLLRAKELGVGGHISFHGVLSDAQLHEQVQQADIFLMLSNHTPSGDFEGFGIAVLEANFLGVPAIGARESGLRDAIRDGYSGYLVDSTNSSEVVRSVKNILADPNGFTERAKAHASHFFWDQVIERYITVLNL